MKKKNHYTLVTGLLACLFFVLTIVLFFVIGLTTKEDEEVNVGLGMLLLVSLIAFVICLVLYCVFIVMQIRQNKKEAKEQPLSSQEAKSEEKECPYCHEMIPSSSIFCPKCGKNLIEENQDMPAPALYEYKGTPNSTFGDYVLLFTYGSFSSLLVFFFAIVIDVVLIVIGVISKQMWTILIGGILAGFVLLMMILIVFAAPLAMYHAQKKNMVMYHTTIYEDRIIVENDIHGKGQPMHNRFVCYFNQFLRAKETKKNFYFVVIDHSKTSCILLKKEELSESICSFLSDKIREAKESR